MTDFYKYAKSKGVPSFTLDKYAKRIMPKSGSGDIMPHVVEERSMNMTVMDVFSRLMMDRIIFLGTEIDDYVANVINAQLLYMESDNAEEPIWLYINSPGGSVYDGLSIYDTMNLVKSPVYTCVTGCAASMAFVLAVSGEKGNRYALKHSRMMQHLPSGIIAGDAKDMEIEVKEINNLKSELFDIISEKTGQKKSKVAKDCDRDHWMRADVAVKYGAIDEILVAHK